LISSSRTIARVSLLALLVLGLLARTPDAALQAGIKAALEKSLGKEVLAGFAVDPDILGGAVVRVGDRVLDGSVRRKLAQLRRQLLAK